MNSKNNFLQLKKWQLKPLTNKVSLVIIIVLTLVLYANTFAHDFTFDDVATITKNSYVQKGFGGIGNILTESSWNGFQPELNMKIYRPFQLFFFAIQYEFFGLNPTPYHIIHVLCYALLNCLIFLMLKEFFRDKYPFLALLITVLFCVHPIHTEVVANLKGSADLFGMLYTTAAFFFLFKYVRQKRMVYFISALLLYFLSLTSKEIAVSYIVIFPLALYYFSDLDLKSIVKYSLPFLGVIGIYLGIRYLVFEGKNANTIDIDYLDNAVLLADTASQWLGMRLYSLGTYLQLLVFPEPLKFMYVFNDIPITEVYHFNAIVALIVYLFLGYLCIKFFKTKSILIFGILFYLISLSLFSNTFVMMPNIIAERWLLIPSLGFCIALGYILYKVITPLKSPKAFVNVNKFAIASISIGLFLFSYKTMGRNKDWKDNTTLFTEEVKKAPKNVLALFSLGSELIKSNNKDTIYSGITYLKKATDELPYYVQANSNLGLGYLRVKDYEKAIVALNKVVHGTPNHIEANNNLWTANNALGIELMNTNQRGNIIKSIAYFKNASELNTINQFAKLQAMHNLGKAYYLLADYNNAITTYNNIVKLDPNKNDSVYALAVVYNAASKHKEALEVLLTLKDKEGVNQIGVETQINIAQNGINL